ncbi:hypothetical protein ACI65C_006286 [Semiaphis heraclei]
MTVLLWNSIRVAASVGYTRPYISKITMPKKKIIYHDEPKAKVVFDPSDTHIPKKRSKYSHTNEKPLKATTVKITTYDRRKKQDTTKSKGSPQDLSVNSVTEVTELLDCMSTGINTVAPIHSTVKSVTRESSKNCFICSKILGKTELVDCPICLIKAHRHCLIVDEPTWKFKLNLCPWFCKQCRKQNCMKCLNDESQLRIQRRCITCKVGLHTICYESYEIKPLQKIATDMYVCIPCMTLATQINPEEEEGIVKAEKIDIDNDDESCTFSIASISSDETDTDSKSNRSNSSTDYEKDDEFHNNKIPNISNWTKKQVFDYLTEVLPQEIIDEIITYVRYY